MALSIRFSNLPACSSLLAVSSVSGSSMTAKSGRRLSLFRPRTAASRPRVAKIAPLDGEPGTLGNTTCWPHQLNLFFWHSNASPLSGRMPSINCEWASCGVFSNALTGTQTSG